MKYRMPVIVAVKNRLWLTKQTVESAMAKPGIPIHLILIDDASEDQDVVDYLKSLDHPDITVQLMEDSKGCGATKNAGAAIADQHEFIYFSDNDIYFHDNWARDMVEALLAHPEVAVLGGDRHPHHGREQELDDIIYSDQQVGFSMLLRQDVWREIGAFQHGKQGLFGVEDTALCTKAVEHGYKVAALKNRVLTHCGLTNSAGGQAAGYPEFFAQEVPEGVIRI